MEKQEIKGYPQKQHSIVGRIFYGVGILTGIAIVCGLLFWRNPFMISSVDASEESVSWQPEETKAYVRVNHMDLRFTGFYTVDTKNEISGYYYIGSIGEQSWFVEIPAETDDAGLSQAMPDLTDMEFVARVSDDMSVLEKAAESESMTTETYIETYNISDRVLLTYDTYREADILYYAIGFLIMLGCFVAGRLFIHET
ncbi:MAG TPA: hypothetical protein DCR27_06655 [Lachnospiraceae bacterium]|nr:hypothetical protein [Lachnospiraceae bacterium]